MICERCGHSMPDGSLTCDNCGTYLGKYAGSVQETGVRAIRQGRVSAAAPVLPSNDSATREYGDYDLSAVPLEGASRAPRRKPVQPVAAQRGSSRPDTRRGVPVNAHGRAPTLKSGHKRTHSVRRHNVNWMLIGVIATVLVLFVGVGAYIYISRSDSGQRATARRNAQAATEEMFALAAETRDQLVQEAREELLKKWNGVSPQAYWLAGQEYLDAGDVEAAIVCFRIGDVVDPENYDGLLLLANAYELNTDDENAERIYLNLTKNISPFRTEAYTALIRMYQEQERGPEAADMMLLAYQNTDRETFRLMRREYIPLTPQTNLEAGRYQINKLEHDVYLTSPQGYDIYYTTDDDAELPQDGILSKDGHFEAAEGSVTLRAVCVSGDLVSDPLSVNYTFYYPSPPAPKCNLAPNTYKSLREVSLRAGDLIEEGITKAERAEIESKYVYYYTIDGSTPTEESPVYDGTPIRLPSGRVKFKAVCVNEFGKMSSTLEVEYKFNVKPGPLDVYSEEDTFSGFELIDTTMDEFTAAFGQPTSTVGTTYLNMTESARRLEYSWGYAVFVLSNAKWQLMHVEMNSQLASGPRGVGFGSSESAVTSVYKDFGQIQSPNGTRGLYYDYPRVGQVLVQSDGTRVVQYTCETVTSNIWVLQYWLTNDRVTKIVHYCQP